jgi:predicted outer membrane repeat protein
MKKFDFVLFTLVILLSTNYSALARIINVPDYQETIQAGIDASEDGDTVLVQPGEYVENIDFDGKAISVIGNRDDPSEVVIDGNQNGNSVVVFSNNETETSLLAGLTIQGGDTDFGGGIFIRDASPRLRQLIISDNTSNNRRGGGIYCTEGGHIDLRYSAVESNTSLYGGGIACFRNTTANLYKVEYMLAVVDYLK